MEYDLTDPAHSKEEAYDLGYLAGQDMANGGQFPGNPYMFGTPNYLCWNFGLSQGLNHEVDMNRG